MSWAKKLGKITGKVLAWTGAALVGLVVVALLAQRYIVRGLTMGAVKG